MKQPPTLTIEEAIVEYRRSIPDRMIHVSNPTSWRKTNVEKHLKEEEGLDAEFKDMLDNIRSVYYSTQRQLNLKS